MEGVVMFQNIYQGRRVLITGHTGFKGAWLTRWLLSLGAEVTGLALAPETTPSLFDLLGLEDQIRHHVADIRDVQAVRLIVEEARPEIVFHLAAQALVRPSYQDPKCTWDTNVGGTVNLLEAIRLTPGVRACVVVTSDKCYENVEQFWGYRESDPLGGHDPYSSSKGAVELAVASWRKSFFQNRGGLRLASARAGNVIGGGDWAPERIVVDFVRAIRAGRPLTLRNPGATRPWQHVLEPLSGYLDLGARLFGEDGWRFAESWNFGPSEASVVTVLALADALVASWGAGEVQVQQEANQPHEAGLLKLDCSKAHALLQWHGTWDFSETVRQVVAWYRGHHEGLVAQELTLQQIDAFEAAAASLGLPWTR
ncbi:CDP-glucose 4,6-dehydratase [Geothrix sp. 21YS21S-2]|uniref:CDP-glucose 4,6-dehydratase n=1 Tax=Geothrix sp. 21YS21S-2 TaxID=3068893 RepID=UPI0027B88A36|nr:CDP-glucose 4,6-dehydratase [Geothrix sp. 21YS21S-2]